MTAAQRAAIVSPATSLLVYQTDGTKGFYFYSAGWKLLDPVAANTTLSNLSTTTAVNRTLLPSTTGSLALGSLSKKWKKGYFSDSVIAGSLTAGSSGVSVGVKGTGSNYGVFGSSGYLGVYGSSSYTGVYGEGGSYGVYGYSSANNGVAGFSSSGKGVYGSGNWGVYGSSGSYGVYGNSSYVGVYGNGTSYGLAGAGQYGVSGTGSYIGVFGESTDGTAVVGNCTNGTGGNFFSNNGYGLVAGTGRGDKNWAGVFNGNLYAYGAYQSSDRNLKKNIQELGDANSIISKLKPKSYEFKNEGNLAFLNLPEGKHYGLLAQDLEEVLPGLVREVVHNSSGQVVAVEAAKDLEDGKAPAAIMQKEAKEGITIKAVNYIELIPLLIKGMQEQQAQIQEQQKQINDLKTQLQTITKKSEPGFSNTSAGRGYLKQNVPNPVKNNTVISYFLPGNTDKAQIRLTDSKGSALKYYTVSNGEGQININSSDLPSGTYYYTLYINDKKMDTKQMVVAK
jgi:hypothetical protein